MRLKNFFLLLTTLAVASVAMAKPVPQDKLNRICDWFFPHRDVIMQSVGAHGEMVLFSPIAAPGFLLLSTDDCVRPVLAYSHTNYFYLENMPEHIREWLEGYERDIASRIAGGEEASPEVVADWQRWLEASPKSNGRYVNPLLTTTWAQFPYYNMWCPYDTTENDYVKVGCAAVAMGQVMKYWNHPATGMGSNTYTSTIAMNGNTYVFGPLSADFGSTTYDWQHMTDNLSASSDSVAVNAVAQLLFHAGVSIEMMYSYYGSGAYLSSFDIIYDPTVENALKYNFRYSQSLTSFYKDDFNNRQWAEMIRNEMDEERPVIYSGYGSDGGHAFVIDGYDSLGLFHINWGWNGESNGYFLIDSLAPTRNNSVVMNFSSDASAIFGIRPMDSVSLTAPVVINMVSNDTTMGRVVGGGIYQPVADTVTVLARAAEGYRFIRWSSGSLNNPRIFLAMDDISDTAFFGPLHEDTLAYCGDAKSSAWRVSPTDPVSWGIRLPSVARHPHKELSAVQLYVGDASPYELRIYLGDSISDATLAYSETYNIQAADGLGQWHTLLLDSVLIVPDDKTLWVTFYVEDCSNVYPATWGRYTGNDDGAWYRNSNGTWIPRADHTRAWLIRAILTSVRQVNVAVSPNDINMGDVVGGGLHWPGDTVTLRAIPRQGYQFVNWGDSSITDNPLVFIVQRDTIMIAYFESLNGITDVASDAPAVILDGRMLTISNLRGLPVEIYDVQGHRLYAETQQAFSIQVQLPAPGVYLLRFSDRPARKVVVLR